MRRTRLVGIILTIGLSMAFGMGRGVAQDLPDCWCVPDVVGNDVKVAIDTCGLDIGYNATCERAVSHPEVKGGQRMYAHGKWVIWFTVDAIKLPPAPRDSIVRITWDAIDTAYPEMRAGFQALEEQFGPFHLDKRLPHKVSGIESQKFYLWFENYANVDTATRALLTIPNTEGGFGDGFGFLTSAVDEFKAAERSGMLVYPVPTGEYLYVRSTGVAPLYIVDRLGIVVRRIDPSREPSATPDSITIDVSDLASGMYFIVSEGRVQQFIVMR